MEQGSLHTQLSFIVEGPRKLGAKWRKLAFIFLSVSISFLDSDDAAVGGRRMRG